MLSYFLKHPRLYKVHFMDQATLNELNNVYKTNINLLEAWQIMAGTFWLGIMTEQHTDRSFWPQWSQQLNFAPNQLL